MTPQEYLDKIGKQYLDKHSYVHKKEFVWLTLIAQAVINATREGSLQEIFNSLEIKE